MLKVFLRYGIFAVLLYGVEPLKVKLIGQKLTISIGRRYMPGIEVIDIFFTVEEPLKSFLIRRGLYQTFLCRVYEYRLGIGRDSGIPKKGNLSKLSEAFLWSKTPEKLEFWLKLSGMDKEN